MGHLVANFSGAPFGSPTGIFDNKAKLTVAIIAKNQENKPPFSR